jgi:maltose-binding protein MalE
MLRKKSVLMIAALILLSTATIAGYLRHSDSSPTASPSSGQKKMNQSTAHVNSIYLKKELYIEVSVDPSEFESLRQMRSKFEQTHPGVVVNLKNIPRDEAYKHFKKSAQSGESADVMLLDNSWVNEFAALGYLSHRADDYVETDQGLQLLQPLLSQVKWNGYVWGIPSDVDPYVMVFNINKLTEYNWQNPPASADQLLALNQQFMRSEPELAGIYIDPADPFAFISLVWSMGGVSALEAFYSPGSKEEDAANTESETPNLVYYDSLAVEGDPWEQLKEGNIAIMITQATEARRHIDERLMIASLPAQQDLMKPTSWLKGRSYVVSSKSPRYEEAFKWIMQMTADLEAQQQRMKIGGSYPANRSAYETAIFQADEQLQQIAIAIKRAGVFPADPYFPRKEKLLRQEMNTFYTGTVDVKQFIENLQPLWSDFLQTGN